MSHISEPFKPKSEFYFEDPVSIYEKLIIPEKSELRESMNLQVYVEEDSDGDQPLIQHEVTSQTDNEQTQQKGHKHVSKAERKKIKK